MAASFVYALSAICLTSEIQEKIQVATIFPKRKNRGMKVSLAQLLASILVTSPLACFAADADWLISPTPGVARIISSDGRQAELNNGLVRRIIRLKPEAATVAFDDLKTGASLLRSVLPEAELRINGDKYAVGGLIGEPIHNYLSGSWIEQLKAQPGGFHFTGMKTGRIVARFPWKRRQEWMSREFAWPPPGESLTLEFAGPDKIQGVKAEVHYEIYDGLPLVSKWIVLKNESGRPVTLDTMTVEELATVEPESIVDGSPSNFRATYRALDVFSDYAFGGNMSPAADAPAIRWTNDPAYETQVHYERKTPCLLVCAPPIGPAQEIEPGGTFESFRVFELAQDSTDRERRGLALRRAYRTLAPWTQENPILMHVRSAKPEAVREAIDQCASVGFELVIMTFGSGFNIENETPGYLAEIKSLADYGGSKNIALGGYSLLASRSIDARNDAINPLTGKPGGMRFGNSPCLGSEWGENYFRKLRQFFEKTGCAVLENDGSYPGDVCASTNHPGHRGLEDSQWKQWRTIAGFYEWCRARGVYLNVPDWYYLDGSSKCGMGYRESNWSLPRAEQEIIERQNIFDGTWEKAPSMGWMFVPLTEYQGGGEAATIEPLKEHLKHYEARLANLFGAGVQACYRGPRLYDAPETEALVRKWVSFYKTHRAILDSDLIHLRRADGRDWDGWLHVNPALDERALAMIYNPLDEPLQRTIRVPLYYAGLDDRAIMTREDGTSENVSVARDFAAEIEVNIPARGRTWLIFRAPK
jgi:hypothetical protein